MMREVTIFISQEIIVTISDLNQNDLKTIEEKKKEMELSSQRNIKIVHLIRKSLVSALLKESIQIYQEYF